MWETKELDWVEHQNVLQGSAVWLFWCSSKHVCMFYASDFPINSPWLQLAIKDLSVLGGCLGGNYRIYSSFLCSDAAHRLWDLLRTTESSYPAALTHHLRLGIYETSKCVRQHEGSIYTSAFSLLRRFTEIQVIQIQPGEKQTQKVRLRFGSFLCWKEEMKLI